MAMVKVDKTGDWLQRRMTNKIGHGVRGCREDIGVASLNDLQNDLRTGVSQRGSMWAETHWGWCKSSWTWSSGVWENNKIKDAILEVILIVIFTLLVQVLKKTEKKWKKEENPRPNLRTAFVYWSVDPGNQWDTIGTWWGGSSGKSFKQKGMVNNISIIERSHHER